MKEVRGGREIVKLIIQLLDRLRKKKTTFLHTFLHFKKVEKLIIPKQLWAKILIIATTIVITAVDIVSVAPQANSAIKVKMVK